MVDNGAEGDETGPETVSVGRSPRQPAALCRVMVMIFI